MERKKVSSMTIIKPVSELRNNFKNISRICHAEGEPVYLTKNGKGDLVVMSMAAFEKRKALLELYDKLSIAELQSRDGAETLDHEHMIDRLRSRLNEDNAD